MRIFSLFEKFLYWLKTYPVVPGQEKYEIFLCEKKICQLTSFVHIVTMFEVVKVAASVWEPEKISELPEALGGMEFSAVDAEDVGSGAAREGGLGEVAEGSYEGDVMGLSDYSGGNSVQCSLLEFWRAVTQVCRFV